MTAHLKKIPRSTRRSRVRPLFDAAADWFARVLSSSANPSDALDMLSLEDRILFDAAPMVDTMPEAGGMVNEQVDEVVHMIDQALHAHLAHSDLAAWSNPDLPPADSDIVHLTDDSPGDAANDADTDDASSLLDSAARELPAVETTDEIVFVDESVSNYEALIRDIQQRGDENTRFEVIAISSRESGVEAVSEVLAQRDGIDAVHFVSHGNATGVQLGSDWLTAENLDRYDGQIGQWRNALDEGADLLIYGCDLAGSSSGQSLLRSLSAMCDCDVAASVDATGHATLGGDWELEYATGLIESDIVFSQQVQADWHSILAIATFQEGVDGYSGTLDTQLDDSTPATDHGGDAVVEVDDSPVRQSLIRFENMFGNGPGQIPFGSLINSANLTIEITDTTGGKIDLHRLLVAWNESDTWNTLASGISLDDVEAVATREARLSDPSEIGPETFVVERLTVQSWSDGGPNYGWVIVNDNANSLQFASSEAATVSSHPTLVVDYSPPATDVAFPVNVTRTNTQQTADTGGASVARADNGTSVMVWQSKGQDNPDGKFGIYAQLYDATGMRMGGEILVNTTTVKDQTNAAVAIDVDGDFVVVWQSDVQDGDGWGIYGQRFDAAGNRVDSEFRVNAVTSNDQSSPSVAMDDAGNFVVAWQSDAQDGDGWGIYSRRYDSSGATQGPDVLVNTLTSFDQTEPSVAMGAMGNFVVTWTASNHQDSSGLGVFGQRFEFNGDPDGLEFQVNSYSTSDQFDSSVSMSDNGDFVVAWTSFGQDGSREGVYGQTYNRDGTKRYDEFQIHTLTNNEQQDLSISMRDDGDVVATWTDLNSDTVYYRRFNLDGLAQSGQAVLDAGTTNQQFSSVALGTNGDFTAVWTGSGPTDAAGVYGRILTGFGNAKPTIALPGGTLNYTESDPATVIDAGATVADLDSLDFAGGSLTAKFGFGGTANDRLTIRNEGIGSGQIGISGSMVTYGGVSIGTYVGGTGTTPLVVSLNANATATATQALARNITYMNVSDGPATDARQVRYYLADGDGAVSLYATKEINVTLVNDPPVISGPAAESVIEGGTLTFQTPWNPITISDVDIGPDPLRVTLTVTNGSLSLGSKNNLTFLVGDGNADPVMVFTGALADVNNALDKLDFGPDNWFVGTANLTIDVEDQGSTGAGGSQFNTKVIPITVTSDGGNDAPKIVKPGNQNGVEGQTLFFSINNANQISLQDDAGLNPVQLTLSITNGTLTLNDTTGLSFTTGDGTADTNMIFTASIADANAALDGMYYQPNASFIGTANLGVDINDLGNTDGDPLAPKTANASLNINVAARNRSPDVSAPTAVATLEGSPFVFSGGNLISFADVDAGNQDLEVTLSVTHGSLTLNTITGLSFTVGDGTNDAATTFRGKLTEINPATLNMTFAPQAGYAGSALLEISVNDLGHTGAGGELVDHESVDITITPDATNSPPVNTVPGTQATDEDTPLALASTTGNLISINDDMGAGDVTVTLTATDGTISLSNTVGGEFRVNTIISGNQQDVQTAMTPDGRFVMVWTSAGQDGSGDGIYAQLFDASGSLVGGEFRVNTTTANNQHEPAVGIDSNGNLVVAWTSDEQDGSATAVIAQRFDAMGVKLGGEFLVNTATADEQRNASVAVDADGDFVIVWQSKNQDGSAWGVYGKRFDSAGNPLDVPGAPPGVKEFRINTQTIDQQLHPVVAMDNTGNFAVAWESENQDGDDFGIFAKHYDAAGNPLDSPLTPPGNPEFQVNTVYLKDQQAPSIAMDDAGNFVIAWQSEKQDYPSGSEAWGVYAQRFNASGNIEGVNFLVNTKVTDSQAAPSVAMAGSGDFVIAWQSLKQDNPDNKAGVFAQRYDAAGTAVGSESLVNSTTVKEQQAPAIAAGDDGHFIVGWQSKSQDTGDSWGVYGQLYKDIRSLTFLVGDGFSDPVIQFQGTIDQINDALDGLIFMPNVNFVGTATLNIVTDDGSLTDNDLVNITVNPVNDAPFVTAPASAAVTESGTLAFSSGNGNAITVGDGDITAAEPVKVTLLATAGTMTLSQTTGLTFLAGDGTNDAAMTFTGSLTDVSAALEGLDFAAPIGSAGGGTVQVNVDDQGNVGSGPALSASATVRLSFNADGANDAPIIITPPPLNTPLNTPLVLDVASGRAPLVIDDSGANPVRVTISVTNGKVSLSPLISQEFRVNTYTTGNQQQSAVAAAPTGEYVVVWQSDDQDGSGYGVYAQRYNAAGQPAGSALRVNTTTADDQQLPAVAMNASGQFAVAWQSTGQDGSGDGIYTRLFGANGLPLTGEVLANSHTENNQTVPRIAIDDAGNFVVVWVSDGQDGDQTGVFAQRFDSAGVAVGVEFRVNTVTVSHQREPALAMDADGDLVIVWSGKDPSSDGIFGQRFDSNGDPVGGEFLINTVVLDAQTVPDVAMDDAGNFVVVWQSNSEDADGPGIIGRRYDSAGIPQGANFRINTTTAGNQTLPTVSVNGTGEFFVAWEHTDGSGQGVFGQRFDAAGAKVGEEVRLNSATSGDQELPDVSLDDFGNVVAVWTSGNNQDGNGDGIFGQRLADLDELSFTSGNGINDSVMVFTGTEADIDDALSGMKFTPTTGFAGVATINLYVDDQGHTGSGGPQVATKNMYIVVGGAGLIVDTTNDLVDGNTGSVGSLNANKGADGKISLREAVIATNNTAGAETILVTAGTYLLTQGSGDDVAAAGDLDINGSLTILGDDARTTIIDGNGLDRVFHTRGTSVVTMSGITVQGGVQSDGGGIFVDDTSTLYLSDTTLTANNQSGTGSGGAIHVHGTADLNRVLISGNTADEGGGIAFHGAVGGSLTNVTISGNTTTGDGGGVWTDMAITITNSTIALNTANSGGGIFDTSGSVTLANSILHNPGSENSNATLISGGFNIDSDGTAGLGDPLDGVDPLLVALADNGGPTKTHALQLASPAIDPLGLTGAPTADQRGFPRDASPDIGAYENVLFNAPPVIANLTGDTLAYTEDDAPTVIEQGGDVFVTDFDSADFNTGSLAVSVHSGGDSSEDILSIRNQGTGAGQIGFDGANVFFSGMSIGTATGGSGGVDLIVLFNANADGVAANALIANIVYHNLDAGAPTTTSRTIRYTLADGDGGVSDPYDTQVNVSVANDAPVLDNTGIMSLTDVNEDDTNPAGDTVASIVASAGDDRVTDVDAASLEGIAVTGVDNTNGTWQYDAGSGWMAFGLVADNSAVLLGSADKIRFVPAPNYNGLAGSITFRAWDQTDGNPGGSTGINVSVNGGTTAYSTASESASLNVNPVNDDPVITSPSTANTLENTTAVLTATSTDIDGGAPTYTITGGADSLAFALNATTGVLTFITAPDYELPLDADTNNVYEVQVTVGDGNGGASVQVISVTVSDVNDAPTISSLAGDALGYSTGAGALIIEQGGNALVADADSPNFDGGRLTVSIVAGGVPLEDVLSFQNQGTNPGEIGFLLGTVTYGSTPIGTAIGGASGADLTVSLNANATPAAVTALVKNITYQNIEIVLPTSGSRTVHFAVNDGDGGSSSAYATFVNVNSTNNLPTITSSLTPNIGENNTIVQTLTATDPDFDPVNFSISGGDDMARFTINVSNQLVFLSPPNFEAPTDRNADNVYEVEILADDGHGGTDVELILVTVDPLNDNNPVFTSGASQSLNENQTIIHTLTAIDADLPAQSLTFSVAATGADSALFTVDGSNRLVFLAPPDFETPLDAGTDNVYNVDVQADDGLGGVTTQSITVTVNPVNDSSPVFTSSNKPILLENTVFVTTVTATDGDLPGQTVDYSIIGGVDADLFTIEGTTGILSFASAPDFEAPLDSDADNIYELNLQADDGNGGATVQSIHVTVTPVNDEQVLATNLPLALNEGGAATIGNALLRTTDADNTPLQLVYTVTTAPSKGTLLLSGVPSGSFTQDDLDNNRVAYQHDGGETTSDSFDFSVDDGQGTISLATFNLVVHSINDAPSLAGIETAELIYTEGDGAVPITGDLIIADVDDAVIESATVRMVGNYDAAQDVLAFTNTVTIGGSWNASAGTLTLTGADSLANYQTALRSVTYENASVTPSAATRTIRFVVHDGESPSNAQTRKIDVRVASNSAPVTAGETYIVYGSTPLVIDSPNEGVLANDFDPEGSFLTATIVAGPAKGAVVLLPDGTFTYSPNARAVGGDEFFYVADDGSEASTPTRVELRIVFGGGPGSDSEPPASSDAGDEGSDSSEEDTSRPRDDVQPPIIATPPGDETPTRDNSQRLGLVPPPMEDIVVTDFEEPADQGISVLELVANPARSNLSDTRDRVKAVANENTEAAGDDSSSNADMTQPFGSPEFAFLAPSGSMWQDLEEFEDSIEQDIHLEAVMTASTLGATTTLSVGYVLWFLRGTYLVSCVLAQMPAWKLIDPLFVFAGTDLLSDDEDESLNAMLERSNHADQDVNSAEDADSPKEQTL